MIGQFARNLSTNLPWLVKNGHPKWKTVDLNAPLKGWEQYDCVSRALGRKDRPGTTAKPTGDNPVMDAIRDMLND